MNANRYRAEYEAAGAWVLISSHAREDAALKAVEGHALYANVRVVDTLAAEMAAKEAAEKAAKRKLVERFEAASRAVGKELVRKGLDVTYGKVNDWSVGEYEVINTVAGVQVGLRFEETVNRDSWRSRGTGRFAAKLVIGWDGKATTYPMKTDGSWSTDKIAAKVAEEIGFAKAAEKAKNDRVAKERDAEAARNRLAKEFGRISPYDKGRYELPAGFELVAGSHGGLYLKVNNLNEAEMRNALNALRDAGLLGEKVEKNSATA